MKRKKRGRKGKIIILCIAVVVLIAAGIFFFVFKGRRTNAMAMASVQAISTTAETGNISTTVVGTGTLQSDTAEDIEIPEGIKIKEVLVESGDKVKQGDTVVFGFRAQAFVTRAYVVPVSGISTGNLVVEGIFDSDGKIVGWPDC